MGLVNMTSRTHPQTFTRRDGNETPNGRLNCQNYTTFREEHSYAHHQPFHGCGDGGCGYPAATTGKR
jgi:hypothetical protein